ncbi:hypothetical protein Rhe02_58950 [Rhizocola hellebori]|uniref:Uncharacterized protein n=1 Tax=Rhizocola hellebori TaxID=1392758 RepID=A0A8J3VJB2_9ACTN|nr:hypothetical protein Rhe02_58950 [Rhizocola hellebori]
MRPRLDLAAASVMNARSDIAELAMPLRHEILQIQTLLWGLEDNEDRQILSQLIDLLSVENRPPELVVCPGCGRLLELGYAGKVTRIYKPEPVVPSSG